MTKIIFSVADEVKQAFDKEFVQEDKSAIVTCLMQKAIEEYRISKKRYNAIDAILALRENQAVVSFDDISNAREELR